jgi:hypothetical protein
MRTKLVDIGPFSLPVTQGHDGIYFVSTQAVADACSVELSGDEPAMMPTSDVVRMIASWAMEGNEKAYKVLIYCAMDNQPETFPGDYAVRLWQFNEGTLGTPFGSEQRDAIRVMVNQRLFGVSHFKCNRDLMNQDQQMDIIAFERLLKSRYRQGQNLESQIMECLDFYQGVNG